MRTKIFLWSFAILFGFSLSLAMISCGENTVADNRSPVEKGQELYVSYCKICHGENGKGAMADLLKVEPPDLTQISARRGGNFPKEVIAKIIDGREPVPGHGTLDMPVWGKTFQESERAYTEEEVKAIIDNLVAYLESIQK